MSGHSKWHNIRLRKQAQDARKSKVFAKISREIMAAAREGGGDPESSVRLRVAMEKASSRSACALSEPVCLPSRKRNKARVRRALGSSSCWFALRRPDTACSISDF